MRHRTFITSNIIGMWMQTACKPVAHAGGRTLVKWCTPLPLRTSALAVRAAPKYVRQGFPSLGPRGVCGAGEEGHTLHAHYRIVCERNCAQGRGSCPAVRHAALCGGGANAETRRMARGAPGSSRAPSRPTAIAPPSRELATGDAAGVALQHVSGARAGA